MLGWILGAMALDTLTTLNETLREQQAREDRDLRKKRKKVKKKT